MGLGTSAENEAILVAEGVTKQFGGVYAVRNASLQVRSDEIIGLIGPNGAGKTSLMNLISGILACDSGSITIDGVRTSSLSPTECARRGVGRTFQNIRVFRNLTVRQNIEVAQTTAHRYRTNGAAEDLCDELMELLGIAPYAEQKSGTLAYGTQRRVEVARALALAPRILLLDEPAAGMNEQESEALLDSIRRISERFRFGIVVIDHDLRFIMNLCGKIYVMHMGEILAEGAPDEVRSDPKVREVYLGSKRG